MRWFGGCVDPTPPVNPPCPAGARMIWRGRFPLWQAGDWHDSELRVLHERDRDVAVIGHCAAARPRFAVADNPDLVIAYPGSYTVVQADHDRAELRIFTDLGSACPIYLTTHGRAVVWGSSARALAGLTGAGVDTSWLAATLVDPAAPSHAARSPFAGITAAPPGARIRLRPGHRPEAEHQILVRRGDRHQAVTRLRHALEDGIAARVRAAATSTSDLSGGLDSTSVCVLAARHVTPPKTLTAVTVHPAGHDRGGDLDYARATACPGGSIQHNLLPLADKHLPYTDLDNVPVTDEPAPSTITYARLAAEFELLAELGSDCHLTGDGGDTLLHPHPGYLADLARTGRWPRLAAHTQGWARLRHTSPWSLLAHATRGRRALRPPGWVTPLATQLAGLSLGPCREDVNTRALREIQTVGRTARADAQLAETFGLRVHNPYTDSAVIAAALCVPPWRRGDPWHYKPLLIDALAGLLPAEVAARTTKGGFDAEHYLGLRAHLPTLLDLADGQLAELGLIHPTRVHTALRHAAAGLPTAFGQLEPMLAIEVWLRALAAAAPITWTTTIATPPGRRP